MKISRKKAIELLRKYKLEEKVIKHCMKVEEFAVDLAKKIEKNGITINVKLVSLSAILHDIGRAKKHGKEHAEESVKILKKEGLCDIAEVVGKHGVFSVDKLETIEQKILFYSDKRIDNEKIVSIDERFYLWFKRYPESKEKLQKLKGKVKKLEQEIKEMLK